MASPVSFGDVVAGINLVRDIGTALKSSGGASAEYRQLIDELYRLERALIGVKDLDLDDTQQGELAAIRASACLCQRTIDDFGTTLAKYQPNLRSGGSANFMKDAWRKVTWSLCKKEDLITFKDELRGHTSALTFQLMILQTNKASIRGRRQDDQAKTITRRLQDGFFGIMSTLQGVAENVATSMQTTAKILRMNIHMFKLVLEMHNVVTHIPAQVERDQPVYLTDANNRTAPFHLEFILTKAAFLTVLEERFSPDCRPKIRNQEFALQARGSARDVNMNEAWQNWFQPGQRIDMSMLLNTRWCEGGDCPSCFWPVPTPEDKDIECPNCGRIFRRLITTETKTAQQELLNTGHRDSDKSLPIRRKCGEIDLHEFERFRRIRVIHAPRPSPLSEDLPPLTADDIVSRRRTSSPTIKKRHYRGSIIYCWNCQCPCPPQIDSCCPTCGRVLVRW